MKRQLVVPMLAARCYVWWALAVMAVTAAAEAGVFYWSLVWGGATPLERLFDGVLFRTVAALGLVAVTLVLWLRGSGGSSHPCYTVMRLPLKRWNVLLWWIFSCTAVYLVFWGVQLAVCLGLCRLYLQTVGDVVPGQTVFLAFYRSGFLHSLLPLEISGRWFGTAAFYLGLGIGAAAGAAARWEGRWNGGAVALAAASWISAGPVGSIGFSILLGLLALGVGGMSLAQVWKEERL